MRRILIAGLTVCSLLGGSSLQAAELISGVEANQNIEKLTSGIDWQHSLSKAEELAQQQNKMIFWLHILGRLDGPACSAAHSVRSLSLSEEPVFSQLQSKYICGVRNIARTNYVGASGKHQPTGNAIETTDGAGPHNVQLFFLAADGTVLHCLPGYWTPVDLAREMEFAERLNKVWLDPELSKPEKDDLFRKMQLAHIKEHPKAMTARSHLQGFDERYEIEHKYFSSDVIANRTLINPSTKQAYPGAMKTIDVLMHERMAAQPFVPYDKFNVAAFINYGKPMYDKDEDFRNIANGQVVGNTSDKPYIGNDPRAHPVQTETKRIAKQTARTGLSTLLRYGLQSALH